ncbi:hypothetical protein GCM10009853_031640 [Glycomyces scopariae]|uniref:Uncharacterized protein n=1 Tax=Glycomyces sambucus TaxID=380244 RepID=A0A1G9CJ71_9ACTN|nr:hypothetical protein [Glycomyces sambucus]SDK51727.1 hypothetical protein SAMN05216298_0369 [Glycomyces sambucus]
MTDAPNPGAVAARLHAHADTDDVEAEVEAALGRLEALPDLPVTEHVAVFEGVQQRLSEILSNVDDA